MANALSGGCREVSCPHLPHSLPFLAAKGASSTQGLGCPPAVPCSGCPLLGQELGTDLQPELWPGGAAVQERPGSSAWVPVGMSGSPCQVGLAACPSAERCARCHAARKSVTRNKGCLLKMLPDCLPSSCFLHSGEIIRNDFILTAQMNTKWNLGYYYCSERAADWNLNGRAAQPRRFGSGTHSGAASQSTLPHQSRQLLSARCL